MNFEERRSARSPSFVLLVSAVASALVVASCESDRGRLLVDSPDASLPDHAPLRESARTGERIDELRTRFRLPYQSGHRAVIGAAFASGFESGPDGVRPLFPADATARIAKQARTTLPTRAAGRVEIVDDSSRVAVGFALRGASDSPISAWRGIALYPGALEGRDVIHRVTEEGTEDYVVFDTRPEREEIAYEVDVSRTAGLRLVGHVLEFLDEGGSPRLRIAPPIVVDATGAAQAATVVVDGCAYDTSPAAPWGRSVTRPGAAHCGVRVVWTSNVYPLLADPSWTTTGSMITARRYHAASMLSSGKVLLTGGSGTSGIVTPTAELYDPASGTFAATGSMASARERHTTNLLASGKVLTAGGLDAGGLSLATAQLYDPTAGTFAATGPLTGPRYSHTATVLPAGGVLLAGGQNGNAHLASAELYDPTAGTFSATGSMATTRLSPTASLLLSGKVLVAGGVANNGYLASAELYDPSAGSFSTTGSMVAARIDHAATVLASGKVLVTGGDNANNPYYLSSAEIYDPSTGTFAATGSMTTMRAYHTSTLLRSGKVLVAAGQALGFAKTSAELFDPGAGVFDATTSLTISRYGHTASVLASGKVLAVGGYNNAGSGALATAEIYDVAPNGGVCVLPDDCVSGLCDDGICCVTTCPGGGVCQTCTPGSGVCATVTSTSDPDTCSGTQTCDAAGACKRVIGQACPGGNADCANAQCVDGYCCNTACASACDVCAATLGASANGTCGPASVGYAGNPACGNGVACSGVAVTCPATACTTDSGCVLADYCAANGTCQPRKSLGAVCSSVAGSDCKAAGCRDCASGNCVDGFCCDTACNGTCLACAGALKQSGTGDGLCGNAKLDTNPHADPCVTDSASTCARDGKCNGSGACSLFYPAGTSCGSSACDLGTNSARGLICNGSGVCGGNPAGVACGQFLCKNGGCPTGCTGDTDCVISAYCSQGICVAKKANGAVCAERRECGQNLCVDGVCCNAPCAGQCEACNVQGGEGTCVPVVGAPVGTRRVCAPGDAQRPCGAAQCDGTVRASCEGYVGPAVSCGEPSCANGQAQATGSCDGRGGCRMSPPSACGTFACNGNVCGVACKVNGDCMPGNKCDTTTGKCVSGASCDGQHTVTSPNGTRTDCAPYICEGSTCKTSCGAVTDCADPFVCDPNGHCVSQPSAPSSEVGGCAIRTKHSELSSTGVLVTLAGLAILRMRRRRSRVPHDSPPPKRR